MAQEETVLVIGILLIILILGFGIFLYWSYVNRRYFFAYTPPQPPNTFQPNGPPKQLTANEKSARFSAITTPSAGNSCNEGQDTDVF